MPHASYTVDSVSSTRLRPLAHGKRSNTYDNLSNFLKRPDEDDYDWLPVAGESAPVSPTVHGSTEELNLPLSTSFLSTKPYILSVSTSALFSQESNVSERRSDEGAAARGSMSSTDYAIYNSMGASSSKHRGKVCARFLQREFTIYITCPIQTWPFYKCSPHSRSFAWGEGRGRLASCLRLVNLIMVHIKGNYCYHKYVRDCNSFRPKSFMVVQVEQAYFCSKRLTSSYDLSVLYQWKKVEFPVWGNIQDSAHSSTIFCSWPEFVHPILYISL